MVDYAKLKTNLNLIIHRLKLVEKKKIELNQKARRQIGEFLNTGKIDRARIRVEQIIREDYLIEAMDILESYCDLILSRFGQLQGSNAIDENLQTAISSIIWIAPRLENDVSELKVISEQLSQKYGKQYIAAVRENTLHTVNETLMRKVNIQAPPAVLVEKYLVEIAKDQKIDYKADPRIMKEHESRHGNSPGGGSGSGGHIMPVPSGPSSSSDELDDEFSRGHQPAHAPSSSRGPQTGYNLIDLGDHYPTASGTGPAPPLPREGPHGGIPNDFPATAPAGTIPIGFNLSALMNQNNEPMSKKPGKSYTGDSSMRPVPSGGSGASGSGSQNPGEAPPPNYDAVMNSSSQLIKPGKIPSADERKDHLSNDTLPELPSVPTGLPDITDTSMNQTSGGSGQSNLDPDFESLARRFEELKNRK